jgi:Flp pilus assembly protein TadG
MATMNPRVRDRQQGQAVIELALTLPLLLLIVFGIFDFGLMLQRYEIVTNAAREGARVGVLPDYTDAQAATRALDYLNAGGLDVPTRACGVAISPATVGTRCAAAVPSTATITGSSPPKVVNQITVTVEYDHEHVFVGPILGLFGSSIGVTRLRAVSTMREE